MSFRRTPSAFIVTEFTGVIKVRFRSSGAIREPLSKTVSSFHAYESLRTFKQEKWRNITMVTRMQHSTCAAISKESNELRTRSVC